MKNKTGVINDPFSQTHNLASKEHCFRLKFVLFCETWGRTDRLHVPKQLSLPDVTVDRPSGSKTVFEKKSSKRAQINFIVENAFQKILAGHFLTQIQQYN